MAKCHYLSVQKYTKELRVKGCVRLRFCFRIYYWCIQSRIYDTEYCEKVQGRYLVQIE